MMCRAAPRRVVLARRRTTTTNQCLAPGSGACTAAAACRSVFVAYRKSLIPFTSPSAHSNTTAYPCASAPSFALGMHSQRGPALNGHGRHVQPCVLTWLVKYSAQLAARHQVQQVFAQHSARAVESPGRASGVQ
jgi:hypothetical protein